MHKYSECKINFGRVDRVAVNHLRQMPLRTIDTLTYSRSRMKQGHWPFSIHNWVYIFHLVHHVLSDPHSDVLCSEVCQTKKLLANMLENVCFFQRNFEAETRRSARRGVWNPNEGLLNNKSKIKFYIINSIESFRMFHFFLGCLQAAWQR